MSLVGYYDSYCFVTSVLKKVIAFITRVSVSNFAITY